MHCLQASTDNDPLYLTDDHIGDSITLTDFLNLTIKGELYDLSAAHAGGDRLFDLIEFLYKYECTAISNGLQARLGALLNLEHSPVFPIFIASCIMEDLVGAHLALLRLGKMRCKTESETPNGHGKKALDVNDEAGQGGHALSPGTWRLQDYERLPMRNMRALLRITTEFEEPTKSVREVADGFYRLLSQTGELPSTRLATVRLCDLYCWGF